MSTTHLETFKKTLKKLGVAFLEETRGGYTYIVVINPDDIPREINLRRDKFWEFDENEELASYP